MRVFELELRVPQNVNGIAADPQPDWSFDNLLSELDSIDKKLNVTTPFTKAQPRELRGASKDSYRSQRVFVMRVPDHESEYSDSDSDSEEEAGNSYRISGRRFACDELYMSDSDDSEEHDVECHLMDKVGLAEGALHELTREHQLSVSDEVRSRISSLETELVNESEKLASSLTKVEKQRESQLERERKFDLHYQRTIAEALDYHLTAVQRDHEHISQIEERKIRDDAAREEAKRREKALQEEKLRQERMKAEEARLTAERAERAKAAAIEADKKAAEEAAAKRVAETLKDASHNAGKDPKGNLGGQKVSAVDAKNVIRASENALELEKRRREIYEELSGKNKALKASANQDYHKHGQVIGRQIKTISATVENIRTKAEELIRLMSSPECPQSISIQLFAEKIVSNCTNQRSSNAIFATGRVIVLVTSKIPVAMDILIAELNRVCIYTVPKHINYSEGAFRSKEAYFQTIGYKEENGKIENIDEFIERLSGYMKLYGALVQAEVGNFQNLHGLKEGWAWLARFLNAVPANLYTAVALHSFLEMAGYALYKRYRNQFEKLLSVIARDFLNALKEGGSEVWSAKVNKVKISIRNYIESNQFKKEPEGLQLRDHLQSNLSNQFNKEHEGYYPSYR